MTLTLDRALALTLGALLLSGLGWLVRAAIYVPPWCCAYAARTVVAAARAGWADAEADERAFAASASPTANLAGGFA